MATPKKKAPETGAWAVRLRDTLLAAACLASGALGSLAFDPGRWGTWVAPIVALAVLLAATYDASPRRAALLSFLYAAGHFGLGLSWTHNSLHVYGGVALPVAITLSTMLGLALALFHAASAWVGRKVAGDAGMGWSLACLVAAWVLLEHARGWAFTGFDWLALGYSQVHRSAIAGYIPTLGTFGATAICGTVAALLAAALMQKSHRASAVPVAVIVAIAAGGQALRRVEFTSPAGEPFTASVLQGAVPQDRQWLSSNIAALPTRYLGLAERAEGRLLVTPESAFPFDWERFDDSGVEAYRDALSWNDGHIVIGTFTASPDTGRPRNSAVVLGADGSQHEYSKRHLTPYGEYLPFAALLEPILRRAQIPYSDLEPGDGDGIVELPYVTIGLSICYESLFPRLFSAPPAEVLVNLTNDSWFDGTGMPRQHLQVAMARALEHGRWLLRASNTGPSAIISPQGRVVSRVLPLGRGIATHEVVPLSGATPYARFGDAPVLLVALGVLIARLVTRRRIN